MDENIIEQNTRLKAIITNLIELNNYPDIRISYYPTGFDYTMARAELITCTGEMLTTEIKYPLICENTEYIEDSLLKDIGYRFLKRAYDMRKNGDTKGHSTDFMYSCKEILKG